MAKGELTRNRILDQAMRIASRDGLEGLTIGSLAGLLSLSKSGLFAHFGSKEALQIAVINHTSEAFSARVAQKIEAAGLGLPKLEAFFFCWLDWIADPELPGGCPILGACFEYDGRQGATRESVLSKQHSMQAKLTEFLETAIEEGHLAQGSDIPQMLFELRAITLSFHFAVRVMSDTAARNHALLAFGSLIERNSPKQIGAE